MKAKLGNEIVDVWKISVDEPEEDNWVIEDFKKKRLHWSGAFVMEAAKKKELADKGLSNEKDSPVEAALSWLLLYTSGTAYAMAFPDDIFLIVNEARIPGFGKLGDWLVRLPDKALAVYSEKNFEKEFELVEVK